MSEVNREGVIEVDREGVIEVDREGVIELDREGVIELDREGVLVPANAAAPTTSRSFSSVISSSTLNNALEAVFT